MKKPVIVIMSFVMLFAFAAPMCAFADDAPCETMTFNEDYYAESEHFELHSGGWEPWGWEVDSNNELTVSAKDSGIMITKIEAVIGFGGEDFDRMDISKGETSDEGMILPGEKVTISKINAPTVTFSGSAGVYFSELTVYYATSPAGFTLSDGSIWIIVILALAAVAAAAVVIGKSRRRRAER